jgi:hypothetical protein
MERSPLVCEHLLHRVTGGSIRLEVHSSFLGVTPSCSMIPTGIMCSRAKYPHARSLLAWPETPVERQSIEDRCRIPLVMRGYGVVAPDGLLVGSDREAKPISSHATPGLGQPSTSASSHASPQQHRRLRGSGSIGWIGSRRDRDPHPSGSRGDTENLGVAVNAMSEFPARRFGQPAFPKGALSWRCAFLPRGSLGR